MTPRTLLLRLRCLVPGPTQHRVLRDLEHRNQALTDALLRAHSRHESMRTFAYDWRAQLKAAEAAATDAGYADQSPAVAIYTLAAQLDTARLERDEALCSLREVIEGAA